MNFKINSKKAQEEMVGFALILVILAVVILVFLSFSLRNKNPTEVQDFETASFVQTLQEYTTTCAIYNPRSFASIRELIRHCSTEEYCYDGSQSCDVLNETIYEILNNSWSVGEDYPKKGYLLNITYRGEEMLSFSEGNLTRTFKGTTQELVNSEITFNLYF